MIVNPRPDPPKPNSRRSLLTVIPRLNGSKSVSLASRSIPLPVSSIKIRRSLPVSSLLTTITRSSESTSALSELNRAFWKIDTHSAYAAGGRRRLGVDPREIEDYPRLNGGDLLYDTLYRPFGRERPHLFDVLMVEKM